MRRALLVLGGVASALGLLGVPASADSGQAGGETHQYVVLYADGASLADGRSAVAAAGGTVRSENAAIGLAEVSVRTTRTSSQEVRAQGAVRAPARDRSIATARPGMGHKFADERLEEERAAGAAAQRRPGREARARHRPAHRLPVGHGDDRRPERRRQPGARRARVTASSSASSTPASTAPIPTSPRTSPTR